MGEFPYRLCPDLASTAATQFRSVVQNFHIRNSPLDWQLNFNSRHSWRIREQNPEWQQIGKADSGCL